jgi:iron-sulfur cluster repair protein YtfE (RIC family)
MLVSLRLQQGEVCPAVDDPFAPLLDCHQRIRTFLGLAQRLARAEGAPAEEVADVARRLVRYFTEGLPRHVEDEDRSLAPRMRAAGLPVDALAHLALMEAQHEALDALLAGLLSTWRALADAPGRLGELAPGLAEAGERFTAQMEAHLLLEERVLFPLAGARLSAAALADIRAEMRARRGARP